MDIRDAAPPADVDLTAVRISAMQRALIGVSVVVMGIGQSILYVILPPLAREISLADWQVGALVSFAGIFFALTKPFWGRMCDRHGGGRVLAVGLFGYGMASLTLGLTADAARSGLLAGGLLFAVLLLTRLIQGGLGSGTLPAAQAMVADQTDRAARTSALAMVSAGLGIGMLLGPMVGAALSWWSLTTALYVLAVVSLAAAIGQVQIGARERHRPARVREPLSLLDPRIRVFLLMDFLLLTFLSIVQAVVSFTFQDRLSLTAVEATQQVGAALAVSAILSLVAQVVVIRKLSPSPRVLLRAGSIVSLIGVVLLFASYSFTALIVASAVIGFGIGLLNPGTTSAASIALERHHQGALAGLSGFCRSMGFVVGPFAGAGAYSLNPQSPLLLAAGVIAAIVVLSYASVAASRAVPAPEPRTAS